MSYSIYWALTSTVANRSCGESNRKIDFSPFPFARRIRPSCPASAHSFSTPRLNMLLTLGLLFYLPYSATASKYFYTVNRHQVISPELIRSRNCVTDGVYRRQSVVTRPLLESSRHLEDLVLPAQETPRINFYVPLFSHTDFCSIGTVNIFAKILCDTDLNRSGVYGTAIEAPI